MKLLMAFASLSLSVSMLMSASLASAEPRGRCTGAPNVCEMIGPSACYLQQGCYVDATSHQCVGSPWSCSLFAEENRCRQQQGCQWLNWAFDGYPDPK